MVNKLKREKERAEKEKSAAVLKNNKKAGSFTPSQNDDSNTVPANAAVHAMHNNNNLKPSSRTSKKELSILLKCDVGSVFPVCIKNRNWLV